MKVEILMADIDKFTTKTKVEERGLVTTIQFNTRVSVEGLARLLYLQRQGAPLLVRIGSQQAVMDLIVLPSTGINKRANGAGTDPQK